MLECVSAVQLIKKTDNLIKRNNTKFLRQLSNEELIKNIKKFKLTFKTAPSVYKLIEKTGDQLIMFKICNEVGKIYPTFFHHSKYLRYFDMFQEIKNEF